MEKKSRERKKYAAGKQGRDNTKLKSHTAGKQTGDQKGSLPIPKKQDATNCEERCWVAKKCGGCAYQAISYEEQLKKKEKQVRELLKGICPVEPIMGMENPYHYRNKVHAAFAHLRDGSVISGVYAEGTHRIVPIDRCLIEDEKADAIIVDIRGLLKSFKIKVYNEDSGYGLLRHVMVRRGFQSGEIMVILVVASPVFPSKNNFVKALRKLHPEITTVILNVNDRKTSMVLGERNITLYGKGYIEDQLCGCTFRVSPSSFYQVNPVQTEKLYQKAIELAALTGNERIIDAYCGIGTIGLIASRYAREVISVELNKDAVRDAIVNAKRNAVKNVKFYQADAGEFMVNMAERGEHVDVVFMDPPRAGSDEAFLSSVVKLQPEKVVYISCNPETLARDLKYLAKKGYRAVTAVPEDQFPWTEHVETVVLLSHKKADSYIHIDVEFGEGEGKIPVDSIAKRAEAYKPKEKVTYKMIKEYIEAKYGFKVHTAYIAEVKRDLGLPMYDAPNAVEELKQPKKHPTPEKVEAIKDALRYFAVI